MANLGELLGTLLASLVHARRIADEETAAVAEYYKTNPLLEGMTIPRVRVPELTIELPLLVKSYEEGQAAVPETKKKIKQAILEKVQKNEHLRSNAEFMSRFDKELDSALDRLDLIKGTIPRNIPLSGISLRDFPQRYFPREAVAQAVDTAFINVTKQLQLSMSSELKKVLDSVRQAARDNAIKTQGTPPILEASILTSEVKEQADKNNVTRVRIVMKEEGLEWSIGENPDATKTSKLTPE